MTKKKPGTPSKNGHVRKSELLRRYAVKLVSIEQLKPSPENEEIYGPINFDTDPALQSTVDSIKRLGLEEPMIATADKYILSGHRRFFAVQHLGWKEVPVRFSQIRRDESTDYHRLLAEYNPQRVKSVAALLSEQFLKNETYVSGDDFLARYYEKEEVEAEFITVEGSKLVEPIGERQSEFLAAAVDVINRLADFWPLTVRQVHYKLLNDPPLTQVTKERNERWRYRNDSASYNKLSSLLVSARYRGHVPLTALDDPTRISQEYDSSDTFLRARARLALVWRPRFLAALSMTNSIQLSARHARISREMAYEHRKADPEFAEEWNDAIESAVDLLHSRVFQRTLDGDLEPVFYMGVPVAYIRKFSDKLQIEMLRAWKPERFKTPGTGGTNIDTGDNILVLTEEMRMKLIAANRERVEALPDTIEGEFRRVESTPAGASSAQPGVNTNTEANDAVGNEES